MSLASPNQFSGIYDPAFSVQRAFEKELIVSRRDAVAFIVCPIPLVSNDTVSGCRSRYGIYLCGRDGLGLRLAYPKRKGIFPVFVSAFCRRRCGIQGAYQPPCCIFYPNGVLAGSNANIEALLNVRIQAYGGGIDYYVCIGGNAECMVPWPE